MMEISGNLWTYHNRGHYIVVTTNGFVKGNGEAVMGRGIAAQAAGKFKALPKYLGTRIQAGGNHVHVFPNQSIITMPVKHNWWEKADLELIRQSCVELLRIAGELELLRKKSIQVYMPRPGCGNGERTWDEVRPILESILDHRFIVVEIKP